MVIRKRTFDVREQKNKSFLFNPQSFPCSEKWEGKDKEVEVEEKPVLISNVCKCQVHRKYPEPSYTMRGKTGGTESLKRGTFKL